jgi:hypothetical protein
VIEAAPTVPLDGGAALVNAGGWLTGGVTITVTV